MSSSPGTCKPGALGCRDLGLTCQWPTNAVRFTCKRRACRDPSGEVHSSAEETRGISPVCLCLLSSHALTQHGHCISRIPQGLCGVAATELMLPSVDAPSLFHICPPPPPQCPTHLTLPATAAGGSSRGRLYFIKSKVHLEEKWLSRTRRNTSRLDEIRAHRRSIRLDALLCLSVAKPAEAPGSTML